MKPWYPELSLEELITLQRRLPPARRGAVLNIPLRNLHPPNQEDLDLKSIEFPTMVVHAEPYESPRHGVHFRWAIVARIHFPRGGTMLEMEQPPNALVRPWVGKLKHARGLCDDWGCIRDESGRMVLKVNCSWMLDKDLYQHRRNNTDPTQPVVDYLLAVLNAPNASPSATEAGQ